MRIMRTGDYCSKATASIHGGAGIAQAARLMLDQHIRFLVVHREGDDLRRPIGVLTDRDIARASTGCGGEPSSALVEDVMTGEPLVARESDDLRGVLQIMKLAGIHRMPVIDARGALSGIVSRDGVMANIAGRMRVLVGSAKSEQLQERHSRVA